MNQIKNQNVSSKSEPFTNYQDVKTKTINWCKKMQSEGLLTPEQYDNCTSTFKDVTSGILPKDFKVPPTGISRNYSLYNTRINKLTSNITGENTNIAMIVTNTGLYMACNTNNDLYFVKDINDSTINQSELYFTFVPINNDVYSIMSSYNKYLITNTTWGANFSGTTIGTMSSWKLSKVDDKIMLESIQYSGFYLSFNDTNNSLKIIYGKDFSHKWLIVPKPETLVNDVNDKYSLYTGIEYLVKKESILTKLKNINIDNISLQNIKKSLITLQTTINNTYDDINSYMQKKMYDDNNLYSLSQSSYETQIASINNASTMSSDQKILTINSIPKPVGSKLSINDINAALFAISSRKLYTSQILQNEISKIDLQINNINISKIIKEYNKFILDINNETATVNSRIQQNTIIIQRQKDTYDVVNKDLDYIGKKQGTYDNIDKTLSFNLDITNNNTIQNSLLVKIYPFIIVLLLLFLIYLSYLTSIKFKANIYDKY